MARQLLGRSYGLDTWADRENDRLVVGCTQDVAPILEANQRDRSDPRPDGPLGRLVARIPVTLYYQWIRQGLIPKGGTGKDVERIRRKVLANSDYSKLLCR